MQTDILNQQLAKEYLQQLKNRSTTHERIFLIFSGVPGSGKTTLARKLARDFEAQYVRHDDIRKIARSHGLDVSKMSMSAISKIVIETIFERDANKFVIIDASLDRTWPVFFEHAEKLKAKPIVIRLDVPREITEQRIRERGEWDFGKVDNLDDFYEQFENSKKQVPADITLSTNYDYKNVHELVRRLIS